MIPALVEERRKRELDGDLSVNETLRYFHLNSERPARTNPRPLGRILPHGEEHALVVRRRRTIILRRRLGPRGLP